MMKTRSSIYCCRLLVHFDTKHEKEFTQVVDLVSKSFDAENDVTLKGVLLCVRAKVNNPQEGMLCTLPRSRKPVEYPAVKPRETANETYSAREFWFNLRCMSRSNNTLMLFIFYASIHFCG